MSWVLLTVAFTLVNGEITDGGHTARQVDMLKTFGPYSTKASCEDDAKAWAAKNVGITSCIGVKR